MHISPIFSHAGSHLEMTKKVNLVQNVQLHMLSSRPEPIMPA